MTQGREHRFEPSCETCDDAETILVCCERRDINDGWCCEFHERIACPDCGESDGWHKENCETGNRHAGF